MTVTEVLCDQIKAYRECFEDARCNVRKLDEAMARYFGQPALHNVIDETPTISPIVLDCSCKSGIALKTKRDGAGYFLSCRSYPDCKAAVWFPASVKKATVVDEYCERVRYAQRYSLGLLRSLQSLFFSP